MIKTFFVASGQTISFKSPTRAEPKSPMNVRYAAAALMAAGLLLSAPAFAQTTPAEKQKTQEGTSMPGPGGGAFNADPNYKQRSQSEGPSMPGPGGGAFNADPNYKQRAQEGTSMPGPVGGAFNADPDYKQRAQNLTPSPNENGIGNTK